MLTSSAIELAESIATSAHRGQVDKINAPYIEHPAMVALLVQRLPEFLAADARAQEAAVCVAWLHDTIEDTGVTADSLAAVGFSPEVVSAVVALTRTPELESDAYYVGIRRNALAKLVKTADVASNLAPERVVRLASETRERLETKYAHALDELGVERSVITSVQQEGPPRLG